MTTFAATGDRFVLVSDPVAQEPTVEIGHFSRQLDRPWPETTASLRNALHELYGEAHVFEYNDLSKFIANIAEHKNDVVLPYWFGENSRSRHGLLPAICEAAGICYVGADAFTKVVCNDKQLSKLIAQNAGFRVPSAIQLQSPDDLSKLPMASYPAVVKPNFEGTSLGIDQRSLVSNANEAYPIAEQVLRALKQPVLVEEFVAGRETSICIFGGRKIVHWIEGVAWEIDGDTNFLNDRLFTFDVKIGDHLFRPIKVTDLLNENDLLAAKRAFTSFEKVEVMRIDGRFTPEGFCVIELTPDLYLGPDGEISSAFAWRGLSYVEMIGALVRNAIENRA